jgi:hypothetical protein
MDTSNFNTLINLIFATDNKETAENFVESDEHLVARVLAKIKNLPQQDREAIAASLSACTVSVPVPLARPAPLLALDVHAAYPLIPMATSTAQPRSLFGNLVALSQRMPAAAAPSSSRQHEGAMPITIQSCCPASTSTTSSIWQAYGPEQDFLLPVLDSPSTSGSSSDVLGLPSLWAAEDQRERYSVTLSSTLDPDAGGSA